MFILFIIMYLLTPFDILPEAVFGLLGFVDDLGIVVGVLCGLAQTFMLVI